MDIAEVPALRFVQRKADEAGLDLRIFMEVGGTSVIAIMGDRVFWSHDEVAEVLEDCLPERTNEEQFFDELAKVDRNNYDGDSYSQCLVSQLAYRYPSLDRSFSTPPYFVAAKWNVSAAAVCFIFGASARSPYDSDPDAALEMAAIVLGLKEGKVRGWND